MPRKKKSTEPAEAEERAAAEASTEEVKKPKRKSVRKPKPVSEESKKDTDAIVEPKSKHDQLIVPIEDIEPRPVAKKDADFLAPAGFSFDLKKPAKHEHGARRKWANSTVRLLGSVLIVLFLVLFALTFYASKFASKENGNITLDKQAQIVAPQQSSGNFKLGVANAPTDVKTVLVNLLNQNLKQASVDQNTSGTFPVVTDDTLFVKNSAQSQSQAVVAYLNSIGIRAKVQNQDTIPDDMVLYLVSTLKSPDISGQTATVSNATGITGLAKKYCDMLRGWHAVSCQAMNATAAQTGNTVSYKSPSALFNLKRTTQFANAKFSQAASGQVEDIKVVLGK